MQIKRPSDPHVDVLEKNFAVFKKFIERTNFSIEATALVDHFAERLAIAPASSRLQYHSAIPGGLVSHSLRVLKTAKKIALALNYSDLDESSLIISCLFHDIGKVGDLENDYYTPETSQWHIDRGMVYKRNENIRFMTINDRSLWLVSHFGMKLSKEEWLAIRLNDGQYTEENSAYKMNEGSLPLLVHQADRLSCEQEKEIMIAGEELV